MDAQTIINAEQQYIVQTYNRAPFVVDRGAGVYLYDTDGRRYTDFVGGIAVNALGYGHPAVSRAIRQQAEKLIHVSNLYHTAPHVALAQRLVDNSFGDRVYFCNSGAEAIEAALKFARRWAGTHFDADKHEFVAFTGSFHGRTMGALAATDRPAYQTPFKPLMPGVKFAEFNNLDSAASAIDAKTCAVLVEPVQGEGGVRPADPDFLAGLREICDERDALLVFDEVQCGLGRTGRLWAHEDYGVTPDMMCLAKPLANGLPIGATLVTKRVADAIHVGDHASTFAANALVCHVATAVFDIVSQPDVLAAVRSKGSYLREALQRLEASQILEVRGRGLLVGMELRGEAMPVIQAGYDLGFILASAGANVLRLVPPLVIGTDHIDELVDALPGLLQHVG